MFNVLTSTSTIVTPALSQSLNSLLLNALQAALLGLSALIAYAIKLWIGSLKYNWEKSLASRFVKVAEQQLTTNPEKLTFAKVQLKKFLPSLSDEELGHLVDEAVVDMNNSLKTVSTP